MKLILVMRGATFQHGSEASKMAVREVMREAIQLKKGGTVVTDLFEAFCEAKSETPDSEFSVQEYDIEDTTVFSTTDDCLLLSRETESSSLSADRKIFFRESLPKDSPSTSFPFKDIALVIKRTIGYPSDIFLAIAENLSARGIRVLNGYELLNRANSKIGQFNLSTDRAIFPETLCIDNDFFSKKGVEQGTIDEKIQVIIRAIKALDQLKWPLVLKPAKGSRAKGILLIENLETLCSYLRLIENGTTMLQYFMEFDGFLLQNLVPTHEDSFKSVYYRVNVVGGKAQSAVRFEYVWQESKTPNTKELVAATENERPINLAFFNQTELKRVITGCNLSQDAVVGIDILVHNTEDRIYFLEFNTTPVIHTIVAQGRKLIYSAEDISSEEMEAAECCINFPHAIVQYCLKTASASLDLSIPSPASAGAVESHKSSGTRVRFLREIADEQGYEIITSSDGRLVSLTERDSRKTQHILGYSFNLNSQADARICDDKSALSDVLSHARIPHVDYKISNPSGRGEYSASTGFMEALTEFAKIHHWDLVLKPKNGSGGAKGIVRCKNSHQLEEAAINFSSRGSAFLVSPFKSIKTEYRVVFLGNEVELIYAKMRPTLCEAEVSCVQGEITPVIVEPHLEDSAEVRLETDPLTVEILTRLATLAAATLNLKFASVDVVEVPFQDDQPQDDRFTIVDKSSTFEVIKINSEVILEKAAQHLPDGERKVKEIYSKAIKQGFFALKKRQEACAADAPSFTPG